MGFRCGIVGLPNVGKSTLFNALTETAQAQAANYPFCTIEPNIGRVAVPDGRLKALGDLARSKAITPTHLNFVDIAGLVRGAAKGEGLGNQFLHNIREVDAIVHVLRCFRDPDVVHVDGRVDPLADAETVETELMLADLDSLERRTVALTKRVHSGEKAARATLELIEAATAVLRQGRPARDTPGVDRAALAGLQLLTTKPVLYLCNVDEDAAASGNEWTKQVETRALAHGCRSVTMCAALEAEIAMLDDPADRALFLTELGIEDTGLDRLISAGYDLLDLITFFTAGPTEARAWTTEVGTAAPAAAGCIHSDFERGFIRAEVVAYDDYVRSGGETGARNAGLLKVEGRDYVVRDGDVCHFLFNV